jgi:hypothetical protein
VRAAAATVLALSACHNAPSQGEAGEHCYPNGTCNVTLSCVGGFCVATLDAPRLDAPADAPADVRVDAPLDAFPCNNDTAYESNDTVGTAYALPNPLPQNPYRLPSLAICPSTDKDIFVVTLPTMQELKADVTYGGGGVLSGALLNAGGTPIAIMTPLSGSPNTIETDASNLPAGQYFIEIYSTTSANNYSLSISLL